MPPEEISLREFIEQAFKAHERTHALLSESLDKTFSAHERLHESQAHSSLERFTGHRNEHDAHNAAHTREHTMTQTALDKAEASMDRRLATMNEFRAALDDANKVMMGRAESLGLHTRTSERLDEIKQDVQVIRESLATMAATLRAERTKEIATATGPLDTRLGTVEAFMIRTGGRDNGIGSFWGWIIGGMGLVGIVVGIILALLK